MAGTIFKIAFHSISIKEQRNRQRRQNLLEVDVQDGDEIHIPNELLQLESQIRKYNLTQQEIDMIKVLSPELRTKYLEDKKNQREKSKSDPVRSQDFVRKFMSTSRSKFFPKYL